MTLLTVVISVPFAFFDWIVPKAKRPSDQGYVDPTEIWMLRDTFFGAADQPPIHEWTNPRGAVPASDLRTWLGNLLQSTLAPFAPFAQLFWPNPKAPKSSITLLTGNDPTKLLLRGQDTFFGAAGEPPHYDWPNPIPARRNVTLFGFVDWLKKVFAVVGFPGRVGAHDRGLGTVGSADHHLTRTVGAADRTYGLVGTATRSVGSVGAADRALGRTGAGDREGMN